MNDPPRAVDPDRSEAEEARLAEELADLGDRLRRGEGIDLTGDNSGHAEEIRRLLTMIRMMDDLAGTVARDADLGALGDFRIIREAGRGGMGVVYEAVQVSLHRRVALKVLLSAAALEPRHVQRFQIEAQAAASLHHPSIVPVFAIGSESGIPFYAMQFIEGKDLGSVIKGWAAERASAPGLTRERIRSIAGLVRQAADALVYAHAHEILHRDIKPSNLLVDEAGHLWITDFGLARIQGELDVTRTGETMGTPRYMSPEQALGRRVPLDGRTDIYSLGVTLYELLTLQAAFDGEDRIELVRKIAEAEPTPPRKIDRSIPVDLETIVLKAMAKVPADRYATAQELADDLQRLLDDRPIRAKRPTVLARAAKWARRNQSIVSAGIIAAVVILVALTSIGVGSIVWLQRHNVALRREVERADANSVLAQRHLFAFELRQAKQYLDMGQIERAQDMIDAIGPGPDGSNRRGFAWHYLSRLARREIIQLRADNRRLAQFALSPDGRTLAVVEREKRIHLWDLATQRHRDLTGSAIYATDPVFSPDGRRLVAIEANRPFGGLERRLGAVVWDVASGRLLTRLPTLRDGATLLRAGFVRGHALVLAQSDPRVGEAFSLWSLEPDPARPRRVGVYPTRDLAEWAPDRDLIIREGDRLRLRDPDSGAVRVELAGSHGSDVGPWAWSEDGRVVAAAVAGRGVVLWDAATGHELDRYSTDPGPFQQILFAPDGSRVAARDDTTGQVHLRDRSSGRSLTVQVDERGRSQRTMTMAFSRDGRYLAVSSWGIPGGTLPVALWDVATGRRVRVCPASTPDGGPAHLAFTPDGRFLILNGATSIELWRLAPDRPIALAGHKDEAWAVAFSRQGDLIATGSDDTDDPQTIKLWDPKSGRLVRGWSGGLGTVSSLAFAPDGRTLASSHLDDPGSVRLWDVASEGLLATLEGHTQRARSVAFHRSGRWLASSASDKTARIWDVAGRRCIHVLEGHEEAVQDVAFSPDGQTLATAGGDGTLRLWEVATGRERRVFTSSEEFLAVAFSPDGALVAAAGELGQVWLWDAESGTLRGTWQCDRAALSALAFAPGGKALAVAGLSGRIQVWDVRTGQELLTLQGEGPQVNGLAFCPDGSTLASASHDGTVKLWCAGPP